MAYMIYQQYTTAIKENYARQANIAAEAASAANCRKWLESLKINPNLRDPLVEQIRVLEEAFLDLLAEEKPG